MPRPAALALIALSGAAALAGCGSAGAAGTSSPPRPAGTAVTATRARTTHHHVTRHRRHAATTAQVSTAAPTTCNAKVAATLETVARRIASQAITGRNVSDAKQRLRHSTALATAVAHGNAAAAQAALEPLLKAQIVRIVVTRGAHVLASHGRTSAMGATHGIISDASGNPVGRYVMSIAGDAAIAGVTHSVTGARVQMRAGSHQVASAGTPVGTGVQRAFTTTAFPSGRLRVTLTSPPPAAGACTGDTRVATITGVAHRLFVTESAGAAVHRVLRHVAADKQFRTAVANDDAATLRAAIVRLFGDHRLHVVRIRAVDAAGKLVNDVGGPYALAPATGPVTSTTGKRLGDVTLSVQDDTGYMKLVRRFTGARAALTKPDGTVVPGSDAIPSSGATIVHYDVTAFPSGPLAVTLAIPNGSTA